MRLCVNGHWFNDVCRCLEYWRGESCDLRDCGEYGFYNETNGLCTCTRGHAGDFCQYEVCLHRHQWYCNETRAESSQDWSQERRPCPVAIRDILPVNNSSDYYCDCGLGVHTFTEVGNSTCLCHAGYYGEFCQWSLCPGGDQWDPIMESCRSSFNTSVNSTERDIHLGFFGYEINYEFGITAVICLSSIFIFLLAARILLKFLKLAPKEGGHDFKEQNYKVKRKTTLDEYFDLFHRRSKPNSVQVEENRIAGIYTIWNDVLQSPSSETGSVDNSEAGERKLTHVSAGPVLDSSGVPSAVLPSAAPVGGRPRSASTQMERPRRGSTQLETVFEAHEMARKRSAEKNEAELEDEVQEEKYRERMINFARQISSDMSTCGSSTTDLN